MDISETKLYTIIGHGCAKHYTLNVCSRAKFFCFPESTRGKTKLFLEGTDIKRFYYVRSNKQKPYSVKGFKLKEPT